MVEGDDHIRCSHVFDCRMEFLPPYDVDQIYDIAVTGFISLDHRTVLSQTMVEGDDHVCCNHFFNDHVEIIRPCDVGQIYDIAVIDLVSLDRRDFISLGKTGFPAALSAGLMRRVDGGCGRVLRQTVQTGSLSLFHP